MLLVALWRWMENRWSTRKARQWQNQVQTINIGKKISFCSSFSLHTMLLSCSSAKACCMSQNREVSAKKLIKNDRYGILVFQIFIKLLHISVNTAKRSLYETNHIIDSTIYTIIMEWRGQLICWLYTIQSKEIMNLLKWVVQRWEK